MQDVARVLRGAGLVAGHVARMADIGAPRTVPFKWSVAAVPEAQRTGQRAGGLPSTVLLCRDPLDNSSVVAIPGCLQANRSTPWAPILA